MAAEFFFVFLTRVLEKWGLKKKHDPVLKEQQRSQLVEDRLKLLRQSHLLCDRVYVLQFHNGGTFYTGASMQKFTCSYEDVAPGIIPVRSSYQSLPVGMVKSVLQDFQKSGYSYSRDINTYRDVAFTNMMRGSGVDTFLYVPIYDIQGYLIGMLCIEWVQNKTKIGRKEHDEAILTSTAIAAYLKRNFKIK